MTRLLLAAGLVYLAAAAAIRVETALLTDPAPARSPRTLLDMYPDPPTPAKVAYERRMLVAEWTSTISMRCARFAFALSLPAFLVALGRRAWGKVPARRRAEIAAAPADHPPRREMDDIEPLTWGQ